MGKKQNESIELIKNYLMNLGYKPGDRIPTQLELAKTLNISARTLRDGINILVNQGFLVPKGRAGTFMAYLERENVVEPIKLFYETRDISAYELINARELLEKAIIAEVCNARTTKDLLLLQQIVDDQSKPGLSRNEELELDKKYHLQLIGSAHNKALDIVGNVILLQLDLLDSKGLYPDNDVIRKDDHQKIIDAIFERNVELSQKLISTHIERCCYLAVNSTDDPLQI